MERVTVGEVDPQSVREGSVRRGLSGPLGATDVALNHYRIAPGEGFPGGVHAHADQEEAFVVLRGTATFETVDGPVVVGEREAIRFGPGEFQTGRNDADEDLVALAIGAPRGSDDVRLPVACRDCGRGNVRLVVGDDVAFVCPDCGASAVPRDCPECDGEHLQVALDDRGDAVAVCRDCGATFDRPPTREEGEL